MGAEQSGESVADPAMVMGALAAKSMGSKWASAAGVDGSSPNKAYTLASQGGVIPETAPKRTTEIQNFKLKDVFHPSVGMGEAAQFLQESAAAGMPDGDYEDGHFLMFPGVASNGDKVLRLMVTYDNSTLCRSIVRTSKGLFLDGSPTPCKSVPEILKYLQEPHTDLQWPIGIWKAVPQGGVQKRPSFGTGQRPTMGTGRSRKGSGGGKWQQQIAATDAKDVKGSLARGSTAPSRRPEPQPLKPVALLRNATGNASQGSSMPDADAMKGLANKRLSVTEDWEAGRHLNAEGVPLNEFGRTVADPASEIGDAVSAVAPKFHQATRAQRMTLLRNSKGSDYIPPDVQRELGSFIQKEQGKHTAGAFEAGQVANATGVALERINASTDIVPGSAGRVYEDFAAGNVHNTKGTDWTQPNVHAEIGQVVGGKRLSVQRDLADGKLDHASGVEEGKYGFVKHDPMKEVGSAIQQRVGGVTSEIESGQMVTSIRSLSPEEVQGRLKIEVSAEAERQQAVAEQRVDAERREREKSKPTFAEKKRMMSLKRRDEQASGVRSRVQQMKDLAKQNEAAKRQHDHEESKRRSSIEAMNFGMSFGQAPDGSEQVSEARLKALEAESQRVQASLSQLESASGLADRHAANAQLRVFAGSNQPPQ